MGATAQATPSRGRGFTLSRDNSAHNQVSFAYWLIQPPMVVGSPAGRNTPAAPAGTDQRMFASARRSGRPQPGSLACVLRSDKT